MNQKIRNTFKLFSVPLVLLAVYLVVYVVWKLLGLPSDNEMLPMVKEWFTQYGLWVVFGTALIEGFLLLGQYFPGGFIIFLGVISAGEDVSRAVEVVLVVCAAFFIAYTLNYWVGKYGWYKLLIKFGMGEHIEISKEALTKRGLNAVFFSYWEPNLASLTATAAGILHVPLLKFLLYSGIGVILWSTFWGALVFVLGETALQLVGLKWVLIIFAIWVLVILVKKFFFGKRREIKTTL